MCIFVDLNNVKRQCLFHGYKLHSESNYDFDYKVMGKIAWT